MRTGSQPDDGQPGGSRPRGEVRVSGPLPAAEAAAVLDLIQRAADPGAIERREVLLEAIVDRHQINSPRGTSSTSSGRCGLAVKP